MKRFAFVSCAVIAGFAHLVSICNNQVPAASNHLDMYVTD